MQYIFIDKQNQSIFFRINFSTTDDVQADHHGKCRSDGGHWQFTSADCSSVFADKDGSCSSHVSLIDGEGVRMHHLNLNQVSSIYSK